MERHAGSKFSPRGGKEKERDLTRGITRENGAAGRANNIRAGVAGGIPRQGDEVLSLSLSLSHRRMLPSFRAETKPARRIRAANGDGGTRGEASFMVLLERLARLRRHTRIAAQQRQHENRGIPVRYQRTAVLPWFPYEEGRKSGRRTARDRDKERERRLGESCDESVFRYFGIA